MREGGKISAIPMRSLARRLALASALLLAGSVGVCYACATADRPAALVKLSQPPGWPEPPKDGLGVVLIDVLVSIDANGRPVSARVLRADIFAPAKDVAIRAALASKYSPEIKACNPVAGAVLVHFEDRPD
jgi:hypothetical protein